MTWRPTEATLFLEKTTAPTVNDDQNDGFLVGDFWLDETNDKAYLNLDITAGAAVWTEITGGGGATDHGALTGLGDSADHAWALLIDGSRSLTGDWDIGDGRKLSADKIAARDAAGLYLVDDGDNGIFVEDGGNVGIGTNSPVVKFHVEGKISAGDSINLAMSSRPINLISTDATMRVWRYTDNTALDPSVELIWGTQTNANDSGNFYWDFFADGIDGSFNIRDRSFGQGDAKRLVIDSSGQVGIGTSSPLMDLDIRGSILVNGGTGGASNVPSSGAGFFLAYDSDGEAGSVTGGSGVAFFTSYDWDATSYKDLWFNAANILMRTNISGNQIVLQSKGGSTIINDETAGNDICLVIDQNDASNWALRVNSSPTNGYGTYFLSPVSNTNPVIRIDNNGGEIFRIQNDGKVGIGTNAPATSAKVDITSTTGALLLPRMTTVQRNALTAVNGMLIYDTTLNQIQGYENGAWRQL